MKLPLQSSIIVFAACLLGCSGPKERRAAESVNSRPDAKTTVVQRIDGAAEMTEGKLQEFEDKYQCKLPTDYRRFLLQHNGGFPSPDCVMIKEDGRTTATDVFCFHCLGDERPWANLEWHCKAFDGRLPKDTLPIGHDSCGNLWLLNVAPDQDGSIAFWDHGSFDTFDETDFAAWPRVANSFQEFIDGLRDYDTKSEDSKLLSRYALVQRAVEGMADTPDSDKRSMLDGAWHCHFEDGNVSMQCVNYVPHAIATHTDGYSQLRAEKGLTKSGPLRLPQ